MYLLNKTACLLSIILLCLTSKTSFSQSWNLAGNTATDPSTDFIGTTDSKSLKIRTNNVLRMNITHNGKVGIGNFSPVFRLDVKGGSINTDSLYRISGVPVLRRDASNNITLGDATAKVMIGVGVPATELDVKGVITASGGNSINWNNAFAWGNHGAAGYILSESDPQVGTNTGNFVPRWSSVTGSLITGTIFDNSSAIGIGTSSVSDCRLGIQQTGSSLSTVKFLNTTKGPNTSWIHFGGGGDWFIRSAANNGNVVLQDQNASGKVSIGGTGASKLNVIQSGTTIATAEFSNLSKGPNVTHAHFGISGDWFIRSASNSGLVVLQDQTGSASVCIGTSTPAAGYKLSVSGKIMCEELKIQLHGNWPDYVFSNDYKLLTPAETEALILEKGHLPGIPSATEIEKNGGIEVGDLQKKLLEKVEELTLHMIRQQKQIDELTGKTSQGIK